MSMVLVLLGVGPILGCGCVVLLQGSEMSPGLHSRNSASGIYFRITRSSECQSPSG